jgi:hypothetical protein
MFAGAFPVLVYRIEDCPQSPTGWPRTIVYERTRVPYDSVLPVSPPGSPREGSDEEDDYIPEYDWKYNLVEVRDWVPYITRHEIAYRNKHSFSFPKNSKRKNNSKNMRRMGKLKQPGGSSCNQRR